jgi:hypothetical protein
MTATAPTIAEQITTVLAVLEQLKMELEVAPIGGPKFIFLMDEQRKYKAILASLRSVEALQRDAARLSALRTALRDAKPALEAAKAFVAKLDAVMADATYQSVWVVNQMHAGPYQGPNYTAELAALRAALAVTCEEANEQ